MKKGSLENKCSGIERKFNGVIQLKDVLPPLFYNVLPALRSFYGLRLCDGCEALELSVGQLAQNRCYRLPFFRNLT